MNKFEKKAYSGWLAAPGFCIFIIIFVIPTISSFYFGFCQWDLHTAKWTGLQNLKTFFTMVNTKDAIKNTIVFTLVGTSINVIVGLILAVCFTSGIKTQGYFKAILFIPSLFGSVVIASAWSSVLHPYGILNQFLGKFGVAPIKWLTDSKWALISCIAVNEWKGIGTTLMIYIGGLSAIPSTYYEAAAIDGVTSTQKFFKITLPLILPSLRSVLTLSMIGGFRHYEMVYSLTGGGPGYSTELIGSAVYKLFANSLFGLATMGYLIIFVFACFVVIPINRYIASKEVDL